MPVLPCPGGDGRGAHGVGGRRCPPPGGLSIKFAIFIEASLKPCRNLAEALPQSRQRLAEPLFSLSAEGGS